MIVLALVCTYYAINRSPILHAWNAHSHCKY